MGRMQSHPVERRAVQIDDVDLVNRIAHVHDQSQGRFLAGFRYSDGAFQIPAQGEVWIVERNTSHEWQLFKRRDKNAEHLDMQDMNPGDTRIQTPTTLRVRATEIDVRTNDDSSSGDPVAVVGNLTVEATSIGLMAKGSTNAALHVGAMYRERKVTVGATASWVLTYTPITVTTVMLFDNGSLVDPNGYGLTGTTLSFPSIATAHTLVVSYQTLP